MQRVVHGTATESESGDLAEDGPVVGWRDGEDLQACDERASRRRRPPGSGWSPGSGLGQGRRGVFIRHAIARLLGLASLECQT